MKLEEKTKLVGGEEEFSLETHTFVGEGVSCAYPLKISIYS